MATKKRFKVRFRALCPNCGKAKLEKAKCCNKSSHRGHLICKTCGFTNF